MFDNFDTTTAAMALAAGLLAYIVSKLFLHKPFYKHPLFGFDTAKQMAKSKGKAVAVDLSAHAIHKNSGKLILDALRQLDRRVPVFVNSQTKRPKKDELVPLSEKDPSAWLRLSKESLSNGLVWDGDLVDRSKIRLLPAELRDLRENDVGQATDGCLGFDTVEGPIKAGSSVSVSLISKGRLVLVRAVTGVSIYAVDVNLGLATDQVLRELGGDLPMHWFPSTTGIRMVYVDSADTPLTTVKATELMPISVLTQEAIDAVKTFDSSDTAVSTYTAEGMFNVVLSSSDKTLVLSDSDAYLAGPQGRSPERENRLVNVLTRTFGKPETKGETVSVTYATPGTNKSCTWFYAPLTLKAVQAPTAEQEAQA